MADDPLPSWNDGPNKQAILDFVAAVTTEGGDQFVPEADRVATFDNDGTLWTEQPLYAQAFFALDQIKTLAPQHPEWQTEQPFAAILAGDQEAMKQFGEEEIGKIMAAAHAGMTTDEFDAQAGPGSHSAKQPALPATSSPSGSTSRSSSCWTTCAPTASAPTSSPAAAST